MILPSNTILHYFTGEAPWAATSIMKRPQMAVVQSTHKTSNFNLYKADLHGAIVGCNLLTTCFRHEKSFRILKHVLKPADNRALKSVVSVWFDKIVPCQIGL